MRAEQGVTLSRLTKALRALDDSASRPATIEDVAKIAGVSIATVSRAIRMPEKVAESTRKKVTAAIARTGYTANAMAQNLRMQRSKMVMVLAHSIADPNFPGILIGLEKVANARGYGVLIGNTEANVEAEEKYLRFLATGMADGLLLLTGHLPVAGWAKSPANTFPATVSVAKPVAQDNFSYVGVDDANGAKLATDYLISLGHKDIAFISGSQGDIVSELRFQGYCNALTSQFKKSSPWRVQGDGSHEGGRAAVERLFIRDTLPTAFVCYNDDTAIGVISALNTRGFNVPKDFSVIGFDDIQFAGNMIPSLTTIRQPRVKIGELAMDALLDHLADPSRKPSKTLLHGDLVVRESCSVPSVER